MIKIAKHVSINSAAAAAAAAAAETRQPPCVRRTRHGAPSHRRSRAHASCCRGQWWCAVREGCGERGVRSVTGCASGIDTNNAPNASLAPSAVASPSRNPSSSSVRPAPAVPPPPLLLLLLLLLLPWRLRIPSALGLSTALSTAVTAAPTCCSCGWVCAYSDSYATVSLHNLPRYLECWMRNKASNSERLSACVGGGGEARRVDDYGRTHLTNVSVWCSSR